MVQSNYCHLIIIFCKQLHFGHWHDGQSVRQWPGRPGFHPRSSHTKDQKKWYLMPPGLTLSIIRYGSRVKGSNPRKRVPRSPTCWCSSYRKGSLSGHPRLRTPTLFTYMVSLNIYSQL